MLQKLLRGELGKARRRKRGSVIVVVVLALAAFGIDWLLREPDMPAPDPGTDLSCEVREVYDGDTVTVGCPQGKLRVRVWGIDAPEMGQEPWGEQSRDHLRELLAPISRVQVQVVDTDRYGRSVARLFAGERDLGLQMVRDGRAAVYEQYNDSRGYRLAQTDAEQAGLGIWSRPGDQQDPSAWRRVNPR